MAVSPIFTTFPGPDTPVFCKVLRDENFFVRLNIPSEWIDLHGADLPTMCVLQMPLRRCWSVGVRVIRGQRFFEVDWDVFVTGNNIERSDTLLFFYRGGGAFNVMRFSDNGIMPSRDREVAEYFHEVLYRTPDSQSDESEGGPPFDYARPMPILPSFTLVLQATDLERGPDLPVIWWKTQVADENFVSPVTLLASHVSYCIYVLIQDETVRVYSGWQRFVRKNNLGVGDTCKFELLPTSTTIFNVSFHR
ncbi:putative B3 domain-containing protein [Salvia divinorum]|uniref:B3 domain-containing protein n=1 Tax=Salvia divinorum TaxID=28513 RepID=A0ABD1FQG6_SALDI